MTNTDRADQTTETPTPDGRRMTRVAADPAIPMWPKVGIVSRIRAVGLAGALESFRDQYRRESGQRRTFLWVPIVFALGILVYEILPREPVQPAMLAAAGLMSLVAIWRYRGNRPFRAWVVLALVAAGAGTAKLRVDLLSGPVPDRPVYGLVEGTVAEVDVRSDRPVRLVLAEPVIKTRQPLELPDRVRISLNSRDNAPPVGKRIALRAKLGPVPGPAMPGGYDPRRAAFYQGIGASGFALGRWQAINAAGGRASPVEYPVERFRQKLAARILANVDDKSGAVAVALLVGERGYIPEKTVQDLRDAGLAHILAISGLHMALFAGTVFFVARAFFAFSGSLALTRPIKKWAALAAIVAALGYLLLSGGNVATMRAFIMATIMFLAVLVDRPALSLRNLAIAALIILALEPESVIEPGFQMSFAAVAALIAFYEVWRERARLGLSEPPATLPGRVFRNMAHGTGAIAMTTLIAGLATGPIGAFHFNHVSLYSLLGNLLALPLLSFVVMPSGLLSLVLMPFGLEALPLAVMATGTDMILTIAEWVSAMDGATAIVASPKPVVFFAYLAGFFWICLWRLPWRWLGLLPVAGAAIAAPLLRNSPDILVSNTGTMVAVRDGSGALRISGRRPSQFVLEQWFRHEGEAVPGRESLSAGVTCDRSACLAELPDGAGWLAHVRHPEAFAEECMKATIIVTPLAAPKNCRAAIVIDHSALERFGAHSITVNASANATQDRVPEFQIKTAYQASRRPWQGPTP